MAILFRTDPVQRILGLLFLSPERVMGLSDIISALEGVAARRTVIYALDRLVEEGYVEKRDAGSTRPTYRANQASYLYDELRSIALKTLGGFSPLSEAISTDDNVVAAAIYGSFAKGTARAASDIDLLMVVDDPADPGVTELTRMLDEAAERLGRSVNVRSYQTGEFERKREGPFLSRVLAQPLIALKGQL